MTRTNPVSRWRGYEAEDRAATCPPAIPSKCPRENCLRLHIETFHCPDVLSRILAILAELGERPVEIDYDRGVKRTRIIIVIDRARIVPTARLLCRIEVLRQVRWADYFDGDGQALDIGWTKRL